MKSILKKNLLILLCLKALSIYSQTGSKNIVLSSQQSGLQYFEARETITLNPGFSYTPNGQTFNAVINENLVCNLDPIPYAEIQNPDTRQINTSLPVGAIPGSANVSANGAAQYSIPIGISPGTNGMVPSIAIVYSSLGGDGLLGKGWDISGLSSITRTGKNIYYDAKVEGVNLDATDNFSLDGSRLIKVGSTYHTSIENFAVITANETAGSAPKWFKVIAKDGTTYEYGNTEDSRIEAQGKSEVLVWNINKITDIAGNYVLFTYHEDNGKGEYWPESIKYTGNATANLLPYNEVRFYYETKSDKSLAYLKGSSIQQSVVLFKIKALTDNEMVNTYEFKYSKDLYTHLSEIIKYGADGLKLNSTLVAWNDPSALNESANSFDNNEKSKFTFGDFDGDGQTDLVCIPNKNIYFGDDKAKLYTVRDDGENFLQKWAVPLIDDYTVYREPRLPNIHTRNQGFLANDFDGDGIDDIVLIKTHDLTPYGECVGTQCYFDEYYLYPSDSSAFLSVANGSKVLFADYNGDGKTESKCFSPNDPLFNNDFYNIDFNGDGKADILAISKDDNAGANSCIIYNGGNTTNELYRAGFPTKWHSVFFGDFNGDGKTDILTYTAANKWQIELSNGILFSAPINMKLNENTIESFGLLLSVPIDPDASEDDNNYYVVDINGDGKADIVEQYIVSGVHSYLNVYYGDGTGNFKMDANWIGNLTPKQNEVYFGDFNGDGSQECFVKTGADTDPARIIRFRPNSKNQLVKSITNGYNFKTEFTYKPLTDFSVYQKGSGQVYPLNDGQFALPVVSSVSINNGIGGNNITSYKYTGAILHKTGKGFLGFTTVKVTDQTTWAASTTTNELNTAYSLLLPKSSLSELSDGTDVSFTTSTNSVKDFGNKILYPYTTLVATTDYTKPQTIYKDFYYSPADILNGNLTYDQVRYDAYITAKNEYTYIKVNNIWRIEKLTSTKTRYGESNYVRTLDYSYYANGFLKDETADKGKAKALKKTLEYDVCGNVLTSSLTASGLQGRQNAFTYDSRYRFMLSSINPYGHTNNFTYDNRFGTVLTDQDPNSLTTTYTYDGFGRLINTQLSTGQAIISTLAWITNGSPALGLYISTTMATGAPVQKTYYDVLGRDILNEQVDWNSLSVYTAKEYLATGEVKRLSEPYYLGITPLWSNYTYDTYHRINTLATPTCSLTYTYAGNTVTTKDCNNKTSSQTFNSDGTVYTATDNGGTITNAYYASGLPKQITAAGGTVQMFYDEYGNQTKLIDPDAGEVNYTYNAFGEVVTQTNNKGQVTTITYDALGRIKTKTAPDMSSSYDYDNIKKGLLYTITSTNTTTQFSYDNYSRPVTTSKLFNNKTYIFSQTYNSTGSVQTKTYPDGLILSYEYDSYGNLAKVKRTDAGHSDLIWECQGMDNLYNITKIKLGNNLVVNNLYDIYGFPTATKTGTLQNMEYVFNTATGNLTTRKDMLTGRNFTETFSYDNLDRLTNSAISANNYATSYYANGNINTKSDAGTFKYTDPRPHAVSAIENPVNISANVQNISFTSFEQPASIQENGTQLNFSYDYDGQRIQAAYTSAAGNWTRLYLGDYEEYTTTVASVQLTTNIHYIAGANGLAAIYVKSSDNTENMYFASTDYLGNLLLLTKQDGTKAEEYSFDAWGRRRNPANWTDYTTLTPHSITYRGYTGHEHLDEFGLINMNGRLYDPVLGRFLSPDNYVQSATTQSFNRFSYCLNNPLKYTDPDGEFWNLVIGAAMGGGMYTVGLLIKDGNLENWDFQEFGKASITGAIGSMSGGAAAMGTQANGAVAGALVGGATGALSGAEWGVAMNGINNLSSGKKFFDNWGEAAKDGAISGAISGALSGGIAGYKYAQSIGANPWTGSKYTNYRGYSNTLKTDVPLNEYDDRYCYAVADEYADHGHYNNKRDAFIKQAKGEHAYNPGDAANKLGIKMGFRSKPRNVKDWEFLGNNLKYGNELLGSYSVGPGVDDNHWVNITSISISDKAKLYGGGTKPAVRTTMWDNNRGLTMGKNYSSVIMYTY